MIITILQMYKQEWQCSKGNRYSNRKLVAFGPNLQGSENEQNLRELGEQTKFMGLREQIKFTRLGEQTKLLGSENIQN